MFNFSQYNYYPMIKTVAILLSAIFYCNCGLTQSDGIITGAEQPEEYLPLLTNRRVGMVVNNTSLTEEEFEKMIGNDN